ncbi:transposable element Tcb1 transposase [Trichonephila clavipes]|nr:transposable element Tcb1 transposase [Trichonephila clavipes]
MKRLHIIDESLNVIKYISTILEPEFMPFIRDLFTSNSSFIFKQDSTPCHSVKSLKDWYRSKIIELLFCPENSPDLCPIENLWYNLKTLVRMRYP